MPELYIVAPEGTVNDMEGNPVPSGKPVVPFAVEGAAAVLRNIAAGGGHMWHVNGDECTQASVDAVKASTPAFFGRTPETLLTTPPTAEEWGPMAAAIEAAHEFAVRNS